MDLADGRHRERITFDNVILATGAATKLLPGTSLSERVVTYEEQILTRELPGSVIIAGAGAIGVEFAYVLSNYGVEVTIVEFLDRMLPLEDEEVSKELAKRYRKLGVEVLTSTSVESIDDSGDTGHGHGHRTPRAAATCRRTRCCRRSGSSRGSRASVWRSWASNSPSAAPSPIDDYMRTNVPHIYAIGDVTAKLMLAHVAEAQGVVAAETIAGAETRNSST